MKAYGAPTPPLLPLNSNRCSDFTFIFVLFFHVCFCLCLYAGVLEKTVEREAAALTKAKTLYKSCINESLIELRGGAPLLDMLPDIFEWPMAVDNWEDDYGKTWRLEDVIARLNEKYGTQLLVNFFVGTDDRDSTSYIIHFDQQTTLGLLSRDYYVCEGPYAEACRAYEQFMFDLAKLIRSDRGLDINETHIREEVTRVVDLERDIANATDTPEDRNNPVLLYNKMELGELNRNFTLEIDSQKFNWSYFTAKIMDTVNISVPESEKIINYSPNYYRRLNFVLAKYTKRDLQNYMVWRFAMNMVVGMSRAYRDTRKAFRKALSGTTSEVAVWRQCALYVNNNLDKAVGRLYVQEAFSEKSKELMEEMIKDIREVFISNLNDLAWMDEETKKAAEEKARAIRERIGYSEDIMDDKYLNNEYKDAYKDFVKQHGEEPTLPGIDLSHDQLFFLNFAQIWCGSHRPEQAVNSIKVDVHSPGMFRVLGSLQNFPEFAKAFNCNKSSNMVSDNICRVW
ncbi:neprilysin-like [Poecilia latipinna]|uniref:neprilysin-like n=1 Tax=Poecilia latipinna TaxID=48699 RepID=UPI00072E468A|nr:PREDICTED: neprilysin-like [Poecilia latipinna]